MNAGPKELKEGFVRSLPDNGPVVMVNLLRFKRASADGDGSGWDAYTRYSKAIPPLLKGVGGTILWAGKGAAKGVGSVPPSNRLRKVKRLFWVFGIFEGTLRTDKCPSGLSSMGGGSNCPSAPVDANAPQCFA